MSRSAPKRSKFKSLVGFLSLLVTMGLLLTACTSTDTSQQAGADESENVRIRVVLGLHRDQEGLEEFALNVNDPTMPEYGKFLSIQEISDRFGASPRTRDRVQSVFDNADIPVAFSSTGGYATVDLTQKEAEQFLGADITVVEIPSGRKFTHLAQDRRIPAELDGAVVEIVDLVNQDLYEQEEKESGSFESQDEFSCDRARDDVNRIHDRYGITDLNKQGALGQGSHVSLLTIDPLDELGLLAWTECFGIGKVLPSYFPMGASIGTEAHDEVNLDIDTIVAAMPRLGRLDVVAFHPFAWVGGAYGSALDIGVRDGRMPDVIISSTTFCESSLTTDDIQLSEYVMASAAASGVSVVVSAGDSGSTSCPEQPDPQLMTQYPAASPFVTGVGGTQLADDDNAEVAAEEAWFRPESDLASGGGDSQNISKPDYQKHDGEQRRIPDVSYLADTQSLPPIPICDWGCTWRRIGGTSAAAPLAAAGFALVKQRMRDDGFVAPALFNPLLYQYAESGSDGLHDITEGSNKLFNDECCDAGVGHDRVTGLGVVNFADLEDYARSLAQQRSGGTFWRYPWLGPAPIRITR